MKAGPATVSKLEALGKRRLRLAKLMARIKTSIEDVDSELFKLATRYSLPSQVGKSEFLKTPDVSIRVTRPEYSPTINPQKFLEALGDTLLFFEVVKVLKVELNVDAWEKAVGEERAKRSSLTASLEQRDPPKPSVVVKEASREPNHRG